MAKMFVFHTFYHALSFNMLFALTSKSASYQLYVKFCFIIILSYSITVTAWLLLTTYLTI